MTKLIIAGTYQEYKSYTEKIKQNSYKYVTGLSDLRGLYGITITCIGTYKNREDWEEIDKYLKMAQIEAKQG